MEDSDVVDVRKRERVDSSEAAGPHKRTNEPVSDAAKKVVALNPVVDDDELIDADADMPVIDDRVDVEETAVAVAYIDIASSSLSKKAKRTAYRAIQRSTERDEKTFLWRWN